VVQPINPKDDYDIDLVCIRDLTIDDITPVGLKDSVGDAHRAFLISHPDGSPRLSPRSRCWTLQYLGEHFHMDTLPAIPDERPDASATAIRITDKDVRGWLDSDPFGFAAWFGSIAQSDRIALREALSKQMQVDDVPEWCLKTPLHRTVQALKRHRDIHFSHTKDRPASIIITTLAALAYLPGGSLLESLISVTERMPQFIQERGATLWIPNPVNEKENFADRWEPGDDRKLFSWLEQAHRDFSGYGDELGVHRVLAKVASTLGGGIAKAAETTIGGTVAAISGAGALGASSAGGLVTRTSRAAPAHGFHHGDRPKREA
jgi:hypothetical protein